MAKGTRAKKSTFNFKVLGIIVGVVAVIAIAAFAFLQLNMKDEVKTKDIVLKKHFKTAKINFNKSFRILVLGSDSRNQNIRGSRSDANMLVQINPDKSANIVSFPRDSYVSIASGGTRKINSALAVGGPDNTVKTIENYSDLKIDYYMVTSFPGFTGIINAVGGLDYTFEKGLNDDLAGAHFSAGKRHLRGGEALAVTRARHVANGDFARQARQQEIAVAALKQEKYRLKNFGLLLRLVPVLTKRTTTDLSNRELFELIKACLEVDPAKVDKTVLQGGTGSGGGASVVHLDRSYANKVFAKMKSAEK